MTDTGWKQFERRCAKDLGTMRIPVTGERAGADCQTERLSVQAKLRRGMPTYLLAWLRGIRETAARTGRVGVVVWKSPRMRDDDALVVLRYADFVALYREIARNGAETPEISGVREAKGEGGLPQYPPEG